MGHDPMSGIRTEPPRAVELEHLALRAEACAARVEEVLRRCGEIQLLNWKSPAGNAYRRRVAEHAAVLRNALDRLHEGGVAIRNRAREAPEYGAAAPPRWP